MVCVCDCRLRIRRALSESIINGGAFECPAVARPPVQYLASFRSPTRTGPVTEPLIAILRPSKTIMLPSYFYCPGVFCREARPGGTTFDLALGTTRVPTRVRMDFRTPGKEELDFKQMIDVVSSGLVEIIMYTGFPVQYK